MIKNVYQDGIENPQILNENTKIKAEINFLKFLSKKDKWREEGVRVQEIFLKKIFIGHFLLRNYHPHTHLSGFMLPLLQELSKSAFREGLNELLKVKSTSPVHLPSEKPLKGKPCAVNSLGKKTK